MVYAHEGDIWTFDVEADSIKKLTSDAGLRHRAPRLTSENEVAYVVDAGASQKLMKRALDGGSATEVLEDSILTFDLSATTIAYIADKPNPGSFSNHVVRLFDTASERTTEIRDLGELLGRGGSDVDEISVEFSSDGTMLAVNDTTMMPGGDLSLWVMDLTGADIVDPRGGSFARWSIDGARVFFLKLSEGLGVVGSRSLAIPSGVESDLPGSTGGFRLAVSPEGGYIAYDDSGSNPSVYSYDLSTNSEKQLLGDSIGARWISEMALLATSTEPCEGCFFPRTQLDEGVRAFLDAPAIPQSFASTVDADVI